MPKVSYPLCLLSVLNTIILSVPRSTKQHISYGVPLNIWVLSEIKFINFFRLDITT